MKLFRKNQIIITTLALMIAAAGYVSYMNGSIGEERTAETGAETADVTYDISDEDGYLEGDIFTDEEPSSEGEPVADAETDTGVLAEEGVAEQTTATDGSMAEAGQTASEGDALAEADGSEGAAEETLNPGETVMTQSVVNNVDYAVEMKMNREQVRSQNKESLMGLINNTNITEQQKQAAVDQMVKLTDIAEREAAAEMLLEAKGFTDVVVSITDESVDVILNMGEVTDAKRAQVEDIVKRKTNIAAENIVISPIEIPQ